jgi:hypothetical protein
MWNDALAGIQKHLIIPTTHSKLSIVAELPQGIGGALLPKMDHLVCFLPGAIALGAAQGISEAEAKRLPSWNANKAQQMSLARELTKTCWGMYKASLRPRGNKAPWTGGSSDSEAKWKKDYNIKPLDAHNLQRPETVESLFIMWRITKDPIYRKWGWEIFKAFMNHTTVGLGEGFSSLNDVNAIPPPRRDNMESFWLVS